MENTELHPSKLAILSRLIKESSLTLEEALLLLKEEEKLVQTYTPNSWPSTISPYFGSSAPLTGTIPLGTGNVLFNTTTSTATTLTPNSTTKADLNT
jgi:hypothetical protein